MKRIQECKEGNFFAVRHQDINEEMENALDDEDNIMDDGLLNKEYSLKTLDQNSYFGEIGLITNL
jgi:hypothetical protein